MDPGEVVLPQLLQHVRKHEQALQGDCVLRQGRRVSDLAHQAVLIDKVDLQLHASDSNMVYVPLLKTMCES